MNKTTNKKLAKAHADRKKYILSQTTTADIIEARYDSYKLINNNKLDYKKHLQWVYAIAVKAASSIDDAKRVIVTVAWHEPESIVEMETAIEKALLLCKSKADVQEILTQLCYELITPCAKLCYGQCFIKIFNRANDFDEK